MTFGGEDLMDIYVTTADGDNKAENGPGAGALFRLRLGIKGMPELYCTYFKFNLLHFY